MAGNKVTLEFAGDASKLEKTNKQVIKSNADVGKSATSASDDLSKAGKSTEAYTDRIGKLGAGVEGMSGAFDSAGAAVSAMVDIQNAGRERASRLARANADVEQAMIDSKQAAVDLRQAQEDLNQAQLDGKQAAIDVEQAEIDARQAKVDAATAQKEYNAAVKEYGPGSAEAAQAAIDLTQAQSDLKQANLDSEQAQADARQANIDATQATVDATQAARDGKDAQLDLNDAMAEANPSGLAKFAENLNMVTPILSGLVGVIGLVTAVQWAWNAAQLASPTTWIILAIVALIAVIVLIATKTDWFQRAWRASWGWIKDAASAVGRWFKDTLWGKWIKGAWDGIMSAGKKVVDWFGKVPGYLKAAGLKLAAIITAPYRAAFNAIASLWNNTVGKLSFTIPSWVPGIGGAGFDVPDIPRFHRGGDVPGPPGSEMLAVLQAGEHVSRSGGGRGDEYWIRVDLGDLGDALLTPIAKAVDKRGGRVTSLGVKVVGGQVR
jgi:hypothetical protein